MEIRNQNLSYFLTTNPGLHKQTLLFLFGSIFQSTEVSLGNLILFWKRRRQKLVFLFFISNNFNTSKKISSKKYSNYFVCGVQVLVGIVWILTAYHYNSSIVPNTFWYLSQNIIFIQYAAFTKRELFLQTPVKLSDLTHILFSCFIRKSWAALLRWALQT